LHSQPKNCLLQSLKQSQSLIIVNRVKATPFKPRTSSYPV